METAFRSNLHAVNIDVEAEAWAVVFVVRGDGEDDVEFLGGGCGDVFCDCVCGLGFAIERMWMWKGGRSAVFFEAVGAADLDSDVEAFQVVDDCHFCCGVGGIVC